MHTCAFKYTWHLQRRAKASKSCEDLKWPWLQRVKDASLHFVARMALPLLARLHRCIAHRPRTAVHGCSRVIMQVLLPVASARPRPQTDVECWLSSVLTPSALASRCDLCTRLVATLHRWTAESIISHWMWFPTYITTKRRNYRSVPSCLAFYIRSLIFRAYQLYTECFFYLDYNNYFIFYLN